MTEVRKNNKRSENMKKLLELQTILDENTRIETIVDKETLKNVIVKIIGVASYSKIRREDMIEIMEEIYREYGINR
jgi:hypothetical protein